MIQARHLFRELREDVASFCSGRSMSGFRVGPQTCALLPEVQDSCHSAKTQDQGHHDHDCAGQVGLPRIDGIAQEPAAIGRIEEEHGDEREHDAIGHLGKENGRDRLEVHG